MAQRLVKVAKVLNVGTTTIVEHLAKNGFEVDNKPTAKISDEMYNVLIKEFKNFADVKERADQLVIGTRPLPKKEPIDGKLYSEIKINYPFNEIIGETYQSVKSQRFHFTFKTEEDKVILINGDVKGYTSQKAVDLVVKQVLEFAPSKNNYKNKVTKNGLYYFLVVNRSGKTIGRGTPYFDNKKEMESTVKVLTEKQEKHLLKGDSPINEKSKIGLTIKGKIDLDKNSGGELIAVTEQNELLDSNKTKQESNAEFIGVIKDNNDKIEKKQVRQIEQVHLNKSILAIAKELNVGMRHIFNILRNLGYEIQKLDSQLIVTGEIHTEILNEFNSTYDNKHTNPQKFNDYFDGNIKKAQVLQIIEEIRSKKHKTLNLHNMDLEYLPKEIAELSQLTSIDLSGNKLEYLPDLNTFKNLKTLNLSNNSFTFYPNELSLLKNLKELDLSNNNLKKVSEKIGLNTRLEKLNLSHTELDVLPIELGYIGNLKKLDVSKNNLEHLPDSIEELDLLRHLDLSNNKLQVLSNKVVQLSNLRYLATSGNHISNIPIEITEGQGNRLKFIIDYIDSIENSTTDKLFEAKLIVVGNGDVGKTSIVNKLIKPRFQFIEGEETTLGIDIKKWKLNVKNIAKFNNETDKITVNIWDFGGQAIYRSTHRFFLTKKAVYLFVWDARGNDTFEHFNYWLNIIKTLGGESPLIMVMNKSDIRTMELDNKSLQDKFNILNFEKVSASTGEGIARLRKTLKKAITGLDHLGEIWSQERIQIKQHFENETEPYITFGEFKGVCKAKGLTREQIKPFAEHLKNLGVLLYFADDNKYKTLKNLIILNPEWATEAVYKALDSKLVKTNNGVFTTKELESLWEKDEDYLDKLDELLELMLKFELCFQLFNKDKFIVPDLLPSTSPEIKPIDLYALNFEYRYHFMPAGILNSFICKNSEYIEEENFWKNGVVLTRDGARAVIHTNPYERNKRIIIKVDGLTQLDKIILLRLITESFEGIHNEYPGLEVKQMIPCNCNVCIDQSAPNSYDYNLLQQYKDNNRISIVCNNSFSDIDIDEMLNGVKKDKRTAYKVFISYSSKDQKYREALSSHFSNLKKSKEISTWFDHQIQAGAEWEKEIEHNLLDSDIILLIISSDFFASEFCYQELEVAMNQHKRRRAIVIPIIARLCDWENSAIGTLNALPSKGKALSKFKDIDEGMTFVVKKIRELIKTKKQA